MRSAIMFFLLGVGSQMVARAGLKMTLSSAAQPAARGAEVLFSGTLTNTSHKERLFLNNLVAAFSNDSQNDIALSSNAFFANVPGILLPDETYEGPLFRISLSKGSPAANYTGTITLQGGVDIDAGSGLASATVTLLATPVDQWRYQTFGDAANAPAANDTSDWDHDGLPNLLEYALNLNARSPDLSAPAAPVVIDGHITFSYVPVASDLTYTIESSTDLRQWDTADVESVTVVDSVPPNRLTFRYKNAVALPGQAFLRLKITRTNAGP